MARGTITKLTLKGFGYIRTGKGADLFFHSKSLAGTPYDKLREGQAVEFTLARGATGPFAQDVRTAS